MKAQDKSMRITGVPEEKERKLMDPPPKKFIPKFRKYKFKNIILHVFSIKKQVEK